MVGEGGKLSSYLNRTNKGRLWEHRELLERKEGPSKINNSEKLKFFAWSVPLFNRLNYVLNIILLLL